MNHIVKYQQIVMESAWVRIIIDRYVEEIKSGLD